MPPPSLLYTDMLKDWLGSAYWGLTVASMWMEEEKSLHIIVLEIKVNHLAFSAFHRLIMGVDSFDEQQCYSGSIYKEATRHGFLSDV